MLLLSDNRRTDHNTNTDPTRSIHEQVSPPSPKLPKSAIRDSVARDARDSIYAAASRPVHHRSKPSLINVTNSIRNAFRKKVERIPKWATPSP